MRVVGREHQPVPAKPLYDVTEMLRAIGFLDRLRRKPDALAHILGRWTPQMRGLRAHALPVLVHAPSERRHPGKAALNHYDLKLREMFQNALEHQARQGVLHASGHGVMLLEVVGRPARAGRWMPAAVTRNVQRQRLAAALGRGIDRPVAAVTERIAGAWGDHDLDKCGIAGALLDLGESRVRISLRHYYCGA